MISIFSKIILINALKVMNQKSHYHSNINYNNIFNK